MHDVIVVGGGVSGCYTSSILPKRLDILVLEKDKKVHPKDSGIVSRRFDEFFSEKSLIKYKIDRIDCISPSGKSFSLKSDEPFAYILKREKFSKYLRKKASENANIGFERVLSLEQKKDFAIVKTESEEYRAKIVLGCDGTNSVVRRCAGINNPQYSIGTMVKTEKKMNGNIQVFFNKYYSPDYFSWIIPKNNEYGLITAIRPREYLTFFARKMSLPSGKMSAYLIPCGMTKSYSNRIILIGDSCGQNKPLTGGGIIFSLRCARIAAEIVKDAIETNNFSSNFLSYYEHKWKREIGNEIKKQLFIRRIYRKLTNREIDTLFDKFGKSIEKTNRFDYDKLSLMWKNLPFLETIKFAISKGRYAF